MEDHPADSLTGLLLAELFLFFLMGPSAWYYAHKDGYEVYWGVEGIEVVER